MPQPYNIRDPDIGLSKEDALGQMNESNESVEKIDGVDVTSILRLKSENAELKKLVEDQDKTLIETRLSLEQTSRQLNEMIKLRNKSEEDRQSERSRLELLKQYHMMQHQSTVDFLAELNAELSHVTSLTAKALSSIAEIRKDFFAKFVNPSAQQQQQTSSVPDLPK